MCGVAGAYLPGPADDATLWRVCRMGETIAYRGPDARRVARVGSSVLASVRLSIVDVRHGHQPYRNEDGTVRVCFNGEIYNHAALRDLVTAKGHRLASRCDGEVIAHLYEEYGPDFVSLLDGQFAIAVADSRHDRLVLARDQFGICPLLWAQTDDGVWFCSEAKGLLAAGVVEAAPDPAALVQLSYFGAVCAPRTAFAGIHALPHGHLAIVDRSGVSVRRYWTLHLPPASEIRPVAEEEACDGLRQRLVAAVEARRQGEYPAVCFLSGGIDSAIVGALLARGAGAEGVRAWCAGSDDAAIDETAAARRTATDLGLQLTVEKFDRKAIAGVFPDLIRHGETPTTSTEAAALFVLARRARESSKVILTGEGADEAFGGYQAFRQARRMAPLARALARPVRPVARTHLRRRYGTDSLLPADRRLGLLRERTGCLPAQAIEWEFCREVMLPVLAEPYRARLAADTQWDGVPIDPEATLGRPRLSASLYIGYQVMLPNYLLTTHGDRLFAGNSTEGRYPFLDREFVEYAASLPPELKLRGHQEKYALRRAAAPWLPPAVTERRKVRFTMPFGDPFVSEDAPELYRHLLSREGLTATGYFDPEAVHGHLARMRGPRADGGIRAALQALATGIAVTLVGTTQLWHHLFIDDQPARADLGTAWRESWVMT